MNEIEPCGYPMLSGLRCAETLGHPGKHYDKFGLRDPEPATVEGDTDE